MSVIHYKSPQSTVTTPCGKGLHKLSVSHTTRPEAVTCARCQKHTDVIRAHADLIKRVETKPAPPTTAHIAFEINPQTAWALAQFCKRSTFTTYREHAVNEAEAYQIKDGLMSLWSALRAQGFDPR